MPGHVFGALAFLIWGLASSVLLRYIPLPGPVATCIGFATGAVGLFAAMRDRSKIMPALRKRAFDIVALSFSAAGCGMTYQWAIKTTTVATATLMHALQPLLTCLVFAPIFLKLKPGRRAFAALALGMIGIAVLLGPDVRLNASWFGIGLGVASAVFFAVFNVQMPKLNDVEPHALLFWTLAIGAFMVLPFALAQPVPAHVGAAGWSLAILYGITNFLVANALYWRAMRSAPITHVALLAYLEPLVSIVAAALWLHEPLKAHTALGGTLVLASGAVVLFGNKKHPST